jgi:hypothetical protein
LNIGKQQGKAAHDDQTDYKSGYDQPKGATAVWFGYCCITHDLS